MTEKKPLIIGNWKMNKTIDETVAFVTDCATRLRPQSPTVALAVPFTALRAAAEAAAGSAIIVGAQNMSDMPDGPLTGEISAAMVQDAGARFIILGHSERRRLFHEDDAMINRKVLMALNYGLMPILCIGEMTEEHRQGQEIVREQLLRCLDGLEAQQIKKCMIAYEPLWAIGTGLAATPAYVGEVKQMLLEQIERVWSDEASSKVSVLYGGSVTPANAQGMLIGSGVDGILVGGAALSLANFMQIIDNATEQT